MSAQPAGRATVNEGHPDGGEPRPSPRSFWAGRLILVVMSAVVAEYGFVRRAWLIGSLGAAVAVVALAFAAFTRTRDR